MAAAPTANGVVGKQHVHSVLRMQAEGAVVTLQPVGGSGPLTVPSLVVDLEAGRVSLEQRDTLSGDFSVVYGIIGLSPLLKGSVLLLITGARQVAVVRGAPVYEVTDTRLLGGTTQGQQPLPDDLRYVELLKEGVDPRGAGRGLYFAYRTDITLSQQQAALAAEDTVAAGRAFWARADPRFFWNRHLLQPLTEAKADAYVVPMMMGSIHQVTGLDFSSAETAYRASIALIARRSVHRVGTRHWRRGADPQGAVANFVESEQLVVLEGPAGPVVSSFVQVRGSIPLLWSQTPNIKYKPTTRVAPPAVYSPAFDRHVRNLVETYKGVVAVNLANQHGTEGKLSAALAGEAQRLAAQVAGFKLVAFDFHKECGASRYHRLSVLWDQIKGDFEAFGYYAEGAGLRLRQGGIFRTNCIDCLDRTNVVQGVLGREHLEALLQRLGVLKPGGALALDFPAVEQQFKVLWADHGDNISRQYAGTGALKSGFTRTGKRTLGGLLDDGVKSMARYYLNNFQDGRKQDALDLVTGTYKLASGKPSPFRLQTSVALPLLVVLACLYFLVHNTTALLRGARDGPLVTALLQMIVLPLALAVVIMVLIVKNGKSLVNRPQLCPQLAQPW